MVYISEKSFLVTGRMDWKRVKEEVGYSWSSRQEMVVFWAEGMIVEMGEVSGLQTLKDLPEWT